MNIYIIVLEYYDESEIIGVESMLPKAIGLADGMVAKSEVHKLSVCAVYEWQIGERFASKLPVYQTEPKSDEMYA